MKNKKKDDRINILNSAQKDLDDGVKIQIKIDQIDLKFGTKWDEDLYIIQYDTKLKPIDTRSITFYIME